MAVKLLPDELTSDSERRKRFMREAPTGATLNHPNICTVYEVGQHQARDFIGIQLVPGETRPRSCAW